MLEVDGVRHAQSGAILRWAGAQTGLYPPTLQLRIDAIVEAVADIIRLMNPMWYKAVLGRSPVTGETLVGLSDGQVRECFTLLNDEVIPARLVQLERNLPATTWSCGAEMTIADLVLFVMHADFLEEGRHPEEIDVADALADCPRLCAIAGRVALVPDVADWYKKQKKAK